MQLNIPPNTESVEITIIEETVQTNCNFRDRSETVLNAFFVIAFLICISICIYLIVVNVNADDTTAIVSTESTIVSTIVSATEINTSSIPIAETTMETTTLTPAGPATTININGLLIPL